MKILGKDEICEMFSDDYFENINYPHKFYLNDDFGLDDAIIEMCLFAKKNNIKIRNKNNFEKTNLNITNEDELVLIISKLVSLMI